MVVFSCCLGRVFGCWLASLAVAYGDTCQAVNGDVCADSLRDPSDDHLALEKKLAQMTEGNPIVRQIFGTKLEERAPDQEIFKLKIACKSMMVSLLRTADPEVETVQQSLAKYCAYHAGGHGVFAHHQQWGSIYNPQLRGMPIYPRPLEFWPELETAISELEAHLPSMIDEYRVAAHEWEPVADQFLKLKGAWNRVRLVDDGGCMRDQFPKSCKALSSFAKSLPRCRGGCLKLPAPYFEAYEIGTANFNRLEPDTQLVRHTSSDNQRIKLHCGILNPSRVALHIANSSMVWREGACFLLDDSFEHVVVSRVSDKPRVILEVKLTHPDFENSSQILDMSDYKRTSKAASLKIPKVVTVQHH